MPLLTDDLDFNHNELDVYPGGNAPQVGAVLI